MCGIVGLVVGHEETAESYLGAVERAAIRLAKRGPDSWGFWNDRRAAFGHRRLKILDLSENGHQPMVSRNGRYIITFNGEIYNYLELKKQLEDEGVKFRSHSDTEVLLEGFSAWGREKLLPKLNGMFTFAIWDTLKQELCLARDRFGVKPLVYYSDEKRFVFSSTISGLMEFRFFKPSIDPISISLYFQALCVPDGRAIFKGVKKLRPGHWMLVSQNGEQSHGAYWQEPKSLTEIMTLRQQLDQYEQLLGEAVQRRLVADVPVGLFLSGGIDSSLVCRFASRLKPNIQTFTISFPGTPQDESQVARQVAKIFKTDHHEEVLRPERALEMIPSVAFDFDEPFADVSALPMLLLSEVTRRHVTVALSGDGGDELFGGYTYHRWIRYFIQLFRYSPARARKWLARTIPLNIFPYRLRLLLHALTRETLPEIYAYMRSSTKEEVSLPLLQIDQPAKLSDIYTSFFNGREVNDSFNYCKLDFNYYLVDEILTKVDRASMAHSLETRNPFLDVTLVEWAWGVPFNLKIAGGITKIISRRLLERYLPANITSQRKRGFEVPIRSWFRGPLAKQVLDLHHYPTWAELYVNRNSVRQLALEHVSGKRNHESLLWSLWTLRNWREGF